MSTLPEEIIPYTSRQNCCRSVVATMSSAMRSRHQLPQTLRLMLRLNPQNLNAVIEDAEVSASVAPKPAAREPAPLPALVRAAQDSTRLPACRNSACGSQSAEAHYRRWFGRRPRLPCSTWPAAPKPAAPGSRCSRACGTALCPSRRCPQVHAHLPTAASKVT